MKRGRAWEAWQARLREGVPPEDLILAVRNYAEDCKSKRIEEQYIQHPATFLSEERDFEDWINREQPKTNEPLFNVLPPEARESQTGGAT